MPAFDPVRDALRTSSSSTASRRATDLSVLLNDPPPMSPSPYSPSSRFSPPDLINVPLTESEMEMYKSFRGQGARRLTKRKRRTSSSPEADPPKKRLAGDVGVVVDHCAFFLPVLRNVTRPPQTTPDRT
jgi:mRNA (guanine-N7-)-methyltransferase